MNDSRRTPMTRRPRLLALSAMLALSAVLPLMAACSSEPPERPRTIVLVVVDTLRADRLGCYGVDRGLTPAIDRFANESVRFQNVQAQAPWTVPAIGSIFASTVPTALWQPDSNAQLRDTLPTLPELLRDHGYRTRACVNSSVLAPRFGFARGFAADDYDDFPSRNDFTRSASETVAETLGWLEGVPAEQPVFLFVHVFDPHLDYTPPRDALQAVLGDAPPATAGDGRFEPGAEILEPGWSPDPAERRRIEMLHNAEVFSTDAAIGTLFDGLRQQGRFDEALVVFTSDHGEEFWEHDGFEHGHTLYDEVLRVPLLVRLPGGSHGGTAIEALVRQIDIAPSILELSDIAAPDSFQGASLMSLVDADATTGGTKAGADSPAASPERPAIAEYLLYGDERKAIRIGRHKLITDEARRPLELYDIVADPGETTNIVDAQTAIVARLTRELERWVGPLAKAPTPEFTFDQDPDLTERLRALGYVREASRKSDGD